MKLIAGYDICMIGVASVWDSCGAQVDRAIYSGSEMVFLVMERDKVTEDEALRYVQDAIENENYGMDSPIIVWEISFAGEQ